MIKIVYFVIKNIKNNIIQNHKKIKFKVAYIWVCSIVRTNRYNFTEKNEEMGKLIIKLIVK